MKKILIIAGLLIGSASVYSYYQYNQLMKYCLSFVGYKIKNLSFSRIVIELNFRIKNNSDIDIKVTSFDFDIFMNGIYATKVKSSTEQKIKSRSFSNISLLIDIEPQKNKALASWSFLSKALSDIGGIKVKASGTITVKALGVEAKDQPVSIEMPLRDMLPDNKQKSNQPCK